jgi:hypothetical protein
MANEPSEDERDRGWRGMDDFIEMDDDWQGWYDYDLDEWYPDDHGQWDRGEVLICMLCGCTECVCSHFYCVVCGWSVEAPEQPLSMVCVCSECRGRVGE